LLYPIEKIISEYYIRKARTKVEKNKYIVIGITGSFGKTSLKNILYSLLKTRYKIAYQNHNYNTLMGLAKYINNYVRDDDEILIVELGVDEVNTMIKFKKLFMLDIALITSIGNMHLSTFKTLDNIKKEKMAISNLLKENGSLFINKDDCTYISGYNNVVYTTKDSLNFSHDLPYKVNLYNRITQTELYLEYQLSYLSLALSVCELLSLNKEEIIFGLENIIVPDKRFKIMKSERDIIIDNSYNSNEKGFKLSIDLIKKYDGFKVVITGGLFELGDEFENINSEIGRYLKDVDLLILVSKDLNHPLKKGFISNSGNEFVQLDDFNKVNDVISKIDKKKIILYTAIGSDFSLK
jgi:UDP-N-acetylmuramoyl-tripeptide--D-alanyl-D-alanine ligase